MRMQGGIQGKPPTVKARQKSVVKDFSNTLFEIESKR